MTVTVAPPSTRWAAHIWIPSGRRGSHVDDVAQVSELMRAPLEDWQLEAVDVLTAFGRGGVPLALEGVVLACRQNGKTFGVVRPIAVAECLFGPPSLSGWSAQLKETAMDTFGELRDLMGRRADGTPYDEDAYVPELGEYVTGVVETDSAEAILFRGGSELAFRTRSKKSGRGRRPRRLYPDEALFITAEQAAAMVPGMARQGPTAQIIYASSPALADSSYLHQLVKRGRAGGDPSLAFVEHCAPGSYQDPGCETPGCDHDIDRPGCRLDDEDYWRAANPAFRTGGMSRGYLAGARRALRADFAHEHLGWHEPPAEGGETIRVEDWSRQVDALSRVKDGARPSFAVDVRPDQRFAAIAVAGERVDGSAHVGLIRHKAGTGWLVDELRELKAKHRPRFIVVDGASAAAAMIPELRQAKLDVTVTSAADMAAACGGLRKSILDRTVWHRGDPLLAAALEQAKRRDLGDGGWAWARKRTDADISPLVAVTLAHWALAKSPKSYDIRKSFG